MTHTPTHTRARAHTHTRADALTPNPNPKPHTHTHIHTHHTHSRTQRPPHIASSREWVEDLIKTEKLRLERLKKWNEEQARTLTLT